MSKLKILANCEKMHLEVNLGVGHFNMNLFAALRNEFNIKIVCQVSPEMKSSYYKLSHVYDELIPSRHFLPSRLNNASWLGEWLYDILKQMDAFYHKKRIDNSLKGTMIEYFPHHFQFTTGQLPKVITCHDLHIFDIPWKYEPREPILKRFIDNMKSASAILTEFPRTFEDLPSMIDGTRDKIFLVASPTLMADVPLKRSSVRKMKEKYLANGGQHLLLFPAQLQAHKNHKNLFSAVSALKKSGTPIKLVCPGSEFKPEITKDIIQHRDSLGLKEHVFFPGFISNEDLRSLYEICTAVISPSLAEGGAYINQEAIAFGRPSACAGIKSAHAHLKQMGAVVPFFNPLDVTEIVNVIRELIKNGTVIVNNNRQARENIARWTWKRVAKRYRDVFHWVANGCQPDEKPSQSEY